MIFTSSVSGLVASPSGPAYAFAKGGIVLLMKSLAVSLGPDGIRCNAICPSAVETPMLARLLPRHPGRAARGVQEYLRRRHDPARPGHHPGGDRERRAVPRLRRVEPDHRRRAPGRRGLHGALTADRSSRSREGNGYPRPRAPAPVFRMRTTLKRGVGQSAGFDRDGADGSGTGTGGASGARLRHDLPRRATPATDTPRERRRTDREWSLFVLTMLVAGVGGGAYLYLHESVSAVAPKSRDDPQDPQREAQGAHRR